MLVLMAFRAGFGEWIRNICKRSLLKGRRAVFNGQQIPVSKAERVHKVRR